MALRGEQASVNLAFGRQTCARAAPAKRLSYRGNNTDLTATIPISPTFGNLATIIGIDRLYGQFRVDDARYLGRRHHLAVLPAITRPHIHVFDEAQDVTGTVEEKSHGQNTMIVTAPLNDHVDFDWQKPSVGRIFDGLQYPTHGKTDIVDGHKRNIIQRIETDGDAAQACALERLGLLPRKQRPIGCEA